MFMFLKNIHILLALSVFVSSSGVSIPKDFCMKKFVQSIVHSFKKECLSDKKDTIKDINTACSKGSSCSQSTQKCPLKSFNIAKSEQDLINHVPVYFTLKSIDTQYFTPIIVRFRVFDYTINTKLLTYLNYHPPPLERDIVVLCQNFRC